MTILWRSRNTTDSGRVCKRHQRLRVRNANEAAGGGPGGPCRSEHAADARTVQSVLASGHIGGNSNCHGLQTERHLVLDYDSKNFRPIRTTANSQIKAAAPTRITRRACGWATREPLSHDRSGMRCSRNTRKPSRDPTIQRPGGPPHNIQEYGRLHQISVAQGSA